MAIINGKDTNNQSDRADLRTQGYYIDNSGVYAPGGGQRVGDTWNAGGGMANGQHQNNEAPNDVFLPIQNGTPMSPSNAQTYDSRQPGVSYIGDSNFSQLYGPGSYFFSAGGPSHYGWMAPGAGASNAGDFLSALLNYATLTNSAPTQRPSASPAGNPALPQQGTAMSQQGSAPNFSSGAYPAQRPVEAAAQQYFSNPSFTTAMVRRGIQ